MTLSNESEDTKKKGKSRETCSRCHRVKPRSCLCYALPDEKPSMLSHTKVIILQHPHEFHHKMNRSVPLLEWSVPLELCIGRRLGDQIPIEIQKLFHPPHLPILIFPKLPEEQNDPTKHVYNLSEIQEKISEWLQRTDPSTDAVSVTKNEADDSVALPQVVLIVLDATWKYAKEMHRANAPHYPSHMLRMALDGKEDLPANFQPSRFELRTTPTSSSSSTAPSNESKTTSTTEAWMSTAECVAWIVSRIEHQPSIYDRTIQILDAAVEQYRSFIAENKTRNREAAALPSHPSQTTNKRPRNG